MDKHKTFDITYFRKPSEILADMIHNRIDTAGMSEAECEEILGQFHKLQTEFDESMERLALRLIVNKIASLGR